MGQITSREELEEWLKDKPADWGRVIAVRATLRVLPHAFGAHIPDNWVAALSLELFRSVAISWAARNFPAHDMAVATATAAAAAFAVSDGFSGLVSARRAAIAADDSYDAYASANYATASRATFKAAAQTAVGQIAFATEYAADTYTAYTAAYAYAAAYTAKTNAASARAARAADATVVWANIHYDCDWLTREGDSASAARHLTHEALWLECDPEGWNEAWGFAKARLAELGQSYSVWIDWYNRRIEGHDAAFDIPGDVDASMTKAILARLAAATDEDFWGKGATYVNTTLQSWIDEAREQAAIDYVASGAPLNLGSEAELASRPELLARFAEVEAELAKLKDQLTSLSDSGHGQIGHNLPKGVGSLRDEEIALLNQRVAELEAIVPAIGAALAKLETVVPAAATVPTQAVEAVAELVVRVPELNLWQRAMQPLEDSTSPEVKKGFESAVGASLLSIPYIAYVTLPEAIRAFLHYFYTVWFPILPG